MPDFIYKKILSGKNELIKQIVALDKKKFRDKNNEFKIEGEKFVKEINNYLRIEKLIVSETYFDLNIEKIKQEFVYDELFVLKEKLFNSLSDVKNSQGILAVFKKKNLSLDNILKSIKKNYLMVGLEKINDPGNLGSIIRNCVAFGVDCLIISSDSVDLYNPKVLRAAAGNIFKINICRECNLSLSLNKLKNDGAKIFATDLKAKKSIYDINFNLKSVLLFGNEANGISKGILNLADGKIKVFMSNNIESLNISVATGILLNKAFNDRSDHFGL